MPAQAGGVSDGPLLEGGVVGGGKRGAGAGLDLGHEDPQAGVGGHGRLLAVGRVERPGGGLGAADGVRR